MVASLIHKVILSKIGRDTILGMVVKVLSIFFTFLSSVILARILGPDGYGTYTYALSIITILAIPAQAGLPKLLIRETARGVVGVNPSAVKGIFQWSARIIGIFSLFIAIGTAIVLYYFFDLSSDKIKMIFLSLILIPLISYKNYFSAALRGIKKIIAGQISEFLIHPIFLLVILLVTKEFMLVEINSIIAMSNYVLAVIIAVIVGGFFFLVFIPSNVRHAKPVISGKIWFGSGVILFLCSGLHVLNNQLSTVILGFYLRSDQLGVYRVAVQIATLASFALQVINLITAPYFAELYAIGNKAKLQNLASLSARLALFINTIVSILLVVFGKMFVQAFFGYEYSASYFPLLILLFGQIVNSSVGSVGYLLNMTGHEKDTMIGVALSVIINVLLNLLLIPCIGIYGAAISTSLATIIWNIILVIRVKQRIGINCLAFCSNN